MKAHISTEFKSVNTMKIIFLVILAIGHVISDKLDRTYLPPPGFKLSGGTAGDLKTPLEFPKQYYTTTRPQSVYPESHTNIDGTQTTGDRNLNRYIQPTQNGNITTPSSARPERIYNLPTTTTSYAFSHTTNSPIENIGNVRNDKVSEEQFNDYRNSDPKNPNLVFGNQFSGQTTLNKPTNNQQYGLSDKSVQLDQNIQPIPGFSDVSLPNRQFVTSTDINQKNSVQPGQFRNFVKPNVIPVNAQNNNPGTLPTATANEVRLPGSFLQTTPVYADLVNRNEPNNFSNQPENMIKNYGSYTNVPTNNYNTGSSAFPPTSSTPFSKINTNEPNRFSGPVTSSTPSYSPSNEITSPNSVPNQLIESGPSTTPGYSGFLNVNVPFNKQVHPERPQAENDRNAVTLNYENVLTPVGFSYSYDTSNGIHADESGTAVDGVKAQGAFSYIGDDGKLYSVIYSADENGFLPRGDHLPTPPPIPEAILRVIEQAKKNKEAGIVEDGSYSDDKYGYKKYQGPMEFYKPMNTNSKYNPAYYNNQNKQPFNPTNGIYPNVYNKEDTIDYIEEDVNSFNDTENPSQISRTPNRRPLYPNNVRNEQRVYDTSDVSSDDKTATIGIDRRPGSNVPISSVGEYTRNKNTKKTGIQENIYPSITDATSVGVTRPTSPRIPITKQKGMEYLSFGTIDDFNPAAVDTKQQISQNIYETKDQNLNQIPINNLINRNGNRVEQPVNNLVSYTFPDNPKTSTSLQNQKDTVENRPTQNQFEQNQNKYINYVPQSRYDQQQYDSTKTTENAKERRPGDENIGYKYVVPKKTFVTTQNNQTSASNLPETTKTYTGQQTTTKPFVTPFVNSSEESEEILNDNREIQRQNQNGIPNRTTAFNKYGQSISQKYPQPTETDFSGSKNLQNDYLPSDNNYSPYKSVSTDNRRPAFQVPGSSVTVPSTTPKFATTYRPSTISAPYDTSLKIQTLPSTSNQFESGFGKGYPTTTYRPNYVINTENQPISIDSQGNQIYFPGSSPIKYTTDIYGRPVQVQSNQVSEINVPTVDKYGRPTAINQNQPQIIKDEYTYVAPTVDINGRPVSLDENKPNQGTQIMETSSTIRPGTGTLDIYEQPIVQPGQQVQTTTIIPSVYSTAPTNQPSSNSFLQPGLVTNPTPGVPYQINTPAYNKPSGNVIGEDFSGPKQQPKFDPKTGYYYK